MRFLPNAINSDCTKREIKIITSVKMQEWKLENEAIKAGVEAARAQEHLSKAEERAAKRTEKRMQKRNE